jgi:hypothetical protein
VFVTVELLYGTWGKRERKSNDRVSIILLNITTVKVGHIMMCVEGC